MNCEIPYFNPIRFLPDSSEWSVISLHCRGISQEFGFSNSNAALVKLYDFSGIQFMIVWVVWLVGGEGLR